MLRFKFAPSANPKGMMLALDRSLAIIEFQPDGTIRWANENFCQTMGYTLSEIQGRHHSIFVDPQSVDSAEYKAFWAKLGRGEFDAREYKRFGKGAREIWIQASYNPIKTARGTVSRIVKIATDITEDKRKSAEDEAKLAALSRVQAIIEFKTNGEIITANENFLATLGYSLSEIKGLHHRMFVEPAYADSQDYQDFWAKLNNGEFIAAEFKRLGKGGKEVWIQASYNPILDLSNKVTKIIKFATDVTDRFRAVHEIGAGLAGLADNNLEYRIARELSPAFKKLRTDFNGSLDRLQATMIKVAGSTHAIQDGLQEMATGSDRLSRRTEQQAASLEQTAAALDEITATVKKAAQAATQARNVVASANDDAKTSTAVVRQAVEAMDGIARSSSRISNTIGVIDEIAFQTNLLALNAGVEAARAGEAGRGFAVIASEVRALAQRSAEAAKEIKSLITTSGAQVDLGVRLVAETGKSLERIMTRVNTINDAVEEIAVGANEEATSLVEVNIAINQMDSVTQQNAALVEEWTAASRALSDDAVQLAQMIGQFSVGTGRTASADPGAQRDPTKAVRSAQPDVLVRTARTGSAVRKIEPKQDQDTWEEF